MICLILLGLIIAVAGFLAGCAFGYDEGFSDGRKRGFGE